MDPNAPPPPTERLVYAEFDDLDDMLRDYRWWHDSEPERETCRPVRPFDLDDAERGWRKRREHERGEALRMTGKFVVRRVDDGEMVGSVSFFDVNTRNRSAEIGYRVGPPFRGQGYATEAVRGLVSWLIDVREMRRVVATTGEFNTASVKLLRRLGFVQEGRKRLHHDVGGVWYDDLMFGLLADELVR